MRFIKFKSWYECYMYSHMYTVNIDDNCLQQGSVHKYTYMLQCVAKLTFSPRNSLSKQIYTPFASLKLLYQINFI